VRAHSGLAHSSASPTVSAATYSKLVEHRASSRPMSIDILSTPRQSQGKIDTT
jgi:hypothetical protein